MKLTIYACDQCDRKPTNPSTMIHIGAISGPVTGGAVDIRGESFAFCNIACLTAFLHAHLNLKD